MVDARKGHLPTNGLEKIYFGTGKRTTLHVDFMSFVTTRLQTSYWVSAAKIYTKEASGLDVVLDKGQNKVNSGTEIRDRGYTHSCLFLICLHTGFGYHI